ncbi:GNAT family N-acetyltransferase [Planctomicrobium sp. SH661]|uniref:GNAT family N-acetyltransferase n=1 Tax=Planctomicrobium sp. SH661 TaxID=3448124 RepID=UPI003F5BB85B
MTQYVPEHAEYLIREELPADRDAIRRLNHEAFGGEAESDLVDALRDQGHAEVSLVVTGNGRIVGHILFSRVTIVTNQGTVSALSLAPMAVHPEFQRRGIGSRLIETGLGRCKEAGHRIVLVLGHPQFYGRFSFSSELARQIKITLRWQ